MYRKESKQKSKNCFKEYAEKSTIHGVRYLTETKSACDKLLWASILIVSLFGCTYSIYKVWQQYENNPIVTSFATTETSIYNIPFPAVTFCPMSKCDTSKFNFTDTYFRLLKNESLDSEELKHFTYVATICDGFIPGRDIFKNDTIKTLGSDFFEVIDKLNPPFQAPSCFFMDADYPCSEIFTPIITDLGICYSFNILDRTSIFKDNVIHYKNFHHVGRTENFNADSGYSPNAGLGAFPRRALRFGANSGLKTYLTHNNSDLDYMCNMAVQGFSLLIHSPLDIPRLTKHNYILPLSKVMMLGIEPNIIRTHREVTKYKPEKRHCYFENERPLKYFKVYTQSNCELECLTNYTLEKCGCVQFYMPRNEGTPICDRFIQLCLSESEAKLLPDEMESKIYKISTDICDCKPSCTYYGYKGEISSSDLVKHRNPLITNWLKSDELQYSIMMIYFKVGQFIAIERKELYGLFGLISNCGGLLGLFIGFSVISLAEIIYFIISHIFNAIKFAFIEY